MYWSIPTILSGWRYSLQRRSRQAVYFGIAYPSFKSLSLPTGLKGVSINSFCDDPTHITVVDSIAVCTALVRSGIRILAAGRSHDPTRMLLGLFLLPMNFIFLIVRGRVGRGLWYIRGFEDRIIGVRPAAEPVPTIVR
jgi:hypothetical protein